MKRSLLCLLFLAGTARADDAIEYNRDVRPILSEACFTCHGPDAKTRKAKLRLDLPEEATKKRGLIFPIKPGDLKESNSWERIISDDADYVMPPKDFKKQLTDKQKEIIKKWIEQGAKYQKHWSFEPIPKSGPGNIDRFLNERIKKAGLAANPEADKTTLIRRVSFALTGLPPSLKELDTYLADKTPRAYETMVDRYLESPRYGEEMARHWLDVARYADTHGLHLDNERMMWKYRDWVVKAFNDNLPYDQFTRWQIAGDLIPNATPEQLTATGFNRCNVTTGEGGSIEPEWIYRNAVDRTSTMAQAFLGLTAGCAVCHDHKFDPISAKEYYSLYAFFLSAADPALDGNVSIVGPFAKLPTKEQQKTLDDAIKAEAEARKQLLEVAAKAEYRDESESKEPRSLGRVLTLFGDVFPLAATSSNTSRNAADWVTDPPFGAKYGRRVLRQANTFFHQDSIQFKLRPVEVGANASFEVWIYPDPKQPPSAISVQLGGGKKVWWGNEVKTGTGYSGGPPGDRIGPLPAPGEWSQLTIKTTDLGLKEGQHIGSLTLQEHGGVVYWDNAKIFGEFDRRTDPLMSFAVWSKSVKGKPIPEFNGDEKQLKTFYLAFIAYPIGELGKAQQADERARADRAIAEDSIPGSLIYRDLGMPREAFVMARGQYDKPGDKVTPDVPKIFPPLKPAGPRATRLDLANWLVAPENPLTARVAVNRIWQQFFGTGLVRTSADFGTQGELPSHPELLDWLADDYRSTGWDTKKLVKRIVMSDAFRRGSKITPEALAKDPNNRLLARAPRFRLDAEQLRDNALFTSGLMNHAIGGRGVNPYQPPNIWEPIGYGDSNTRYYLQDHGAALYRRSLYTFIKRTAPHPFLANFDAPNREQVCAVRDRTNTPLQALQLMNDVQHFEAARALAERVLAEGGKTDVDRVEWLWRVVQSRVPEPDEVKLVIAALEKQRTIYKKDPVAAKKVVHSGESEPKGAAADDEVAAWTMIANLILNLDESITRN